MIIWFLFDSSFNGGTIGQKQLAEVERMIASMAYVHLLTDVGENALSVEDNFILSTIGSNGMARFGSAGLCKIIYPGEQIMQYCSMRWITELVDSYWMRIDKRFEEELILAREEQAMNPRIQLSWNYRALSGDFFGGDIRRTLQVWHPYMLRFSCRVMMEQIFRLQIAFWSRLRR